MSEKAPKKGHFQFWPARNTSSWLTGRRHKSQYPYSFSLSSEYITLMFFLFFFVKLKAFIFSPCFQMSSCPAGGCSLTERGIDGIYEASGQRMKVFQELYGPSSWPYRGTSKPPSKHIYIPPQISLFRLSDSLTALSCLLIAVTFVGEKLFYFVGLVAGVKVVMLRGKILQYFSTRKSNSTLGVWRKLSYFSVYIFK